MTVAYELAQSEMAEGLHKKIAGSPEKEHMDDAGSLIVRLLFLL
jgi:hypothetical protein